MEKISVIIPTYNRGAELIASVDSVLNQTYSNIEVIVVDDCSTDNTEEVVRGIKDERVKYIKLSENQGAAGARNAGVEYAQSEIVAFQDSDDLWRQDKLEKQMLYWEQHPQYAMVYGSYMMHMPEASYQTPNDDWPGELEGDIFYWLLQRNTVGAPTILVRKDSFIEAGGFDAGMRCLEDWEFAIRFSQLYQIGYVRDVLVDAHHSEGGVSSQYAAYYQLRCMMIARYKEALLQYGIFDTVVNDLFQRAESDNILENVKKMLLLYLSGK